MTPRTWLPDPSHYPEQMTPLSATVWFEALGLGLHEAMRELRGPFGGFVARTELGWAYEGELEPDWEADPDALPVAARGLQARWTDELKPRAASITGDLHEMRPERPPPADAAAMFDRMWDLVREQWVIHFLAVVPAQAAIQLLADAYREAFPEETDPLAAYRLVDHLPNESTRADDRLRGIALIARKLGVDDILLEYPPEAVLARLNELELGRSVTSALHDYLMSYGGRSRWHELSLPREVEQPTLTLQSLRLSLQAQGDPRKRDDDRGDAGERAVAEALSRAPALEDVLPIARFGYDLKESHAYDIDYPGLLATREVLLGFGRRLLAEGRIDDLDDVWMLTRTELRAAAAGEPVIDGVGADGSLRGLVLERQDELARGMREGPKPFLGEPPEQTERPAVLESFYGAVGAASDGATAIMRGTGASAGTAEGTARVVTDAAGFGRVESGDVLVATTTTPAWTPLFSSLAGLITETGGVLSHAAIVAREYGLPTVVGVPEATRRIPDGARVRVDGAAGEVRIVHPDG